MKPKVKALALLLLWFGLVPALALGQEYPTKLIRIVAAFAAGSTTDVMARVVASKLADVLGQTVIVENRGGAGGNIASKFVAGASPDGYTLLVNTAAMSINASLYKNPGFDIYADFVPVALTASTPGIFTVSASNPARSLADLIRQAKDKGLTYATAGVGSSSHLAGDYLFRALAGVQATHVPYQGGGPAITAAISNQVDVLSASMPPVMPFIRQGKLRVLAVSSLKRIEALPEVPTVAEAGYPDFEERSWVGVFAPARTGNDIVRRLNAEINQVLALPDIRERLASLGQEPSPGTPGEFAAYLKREVAKWARIVKTAGVSAD